MSKRIEEARNTFMEAQKYLQTARRGMSRPQIFTPTILYNLTALAYEKYCMAFLGVHNMLPEGHTLYDLTDAISGIVELDEDMVEQALYFDRQQQICHLIEYSRAEFKMQDIENFIVLTEKLAKILDLEEKIPELTTVHNAEEVFALTKPAPRI